MEIFKALVRRWPAQGGSDFLSRRIDATKRIGLGRFQLGIIKSGQYVGPAFYSLLHLVQQLTGPFGLPIDQQGIKAEPEQTLVTFEQASLIVFLEQVRAVRLRGHDCINSSLIKSWKIG